jgi:hypothetical protein
MGIKESAGARVRLSQGGRTAVLVLVGAVEVSVVVVTVAVTVLVCGCQHARYARWKGFVSSLDLRGRRDSHESHKGAAVGAADRDCRLSRSSGDSADAIVGAAGMGDACPGGEAEDEGSVCNPHLICYSEGNVCMS